ncbi:VanZ family protein [Streptomyces sp. ME19-01-6]|uniref:VanZ family protein n=1 Tax=Streptomyces sp. ME19-01-6 TaxID=3028686 RepID=UPI0029ACBD84|nr:VanZ family protein [Streptomyces sp. ME19-01-6]MDX3227500.1 VanZ family protein [Streptomyces sp. ME19-01-6]
MTHAYLLPITTAAALFPLLALALFLPTAVVLYRRHGVMSRGRALSLYGFLYYALSAFCMTVVPLPMRSPDMCAGYAMVAAPQLIPGNTFGDIWKEAHGKVTFNALVLQNPAVAGTLFNLLLLLPLGVFLRYHFRRGPRAAAALGFGASLFFELTQWSGVWGLYACPYRLFDVDDLIVNTSGAMLGWILAGPVARRLPTLETLDGRALARHPVPFGRRLTALVVDLVGYAAATLLAVVVSQGLGGADLLPWVPVAVFAGWFVVLPYLTGATPGKRLLRLRLVPTGGGALPLWRPAVRALVLGVAALPLLAGLSLATAVLLFEPSLPDLIDTATATARQANGEDAVYLAASSPEQTRVVVLGIALLVTYGLRTLRHPEGLGPHETLSGLRNEALPHTRARRPRGTVAARPVAAPVAVAVAVAVAVKEAAPGQKTLTSV